MTDSAKAVFLSYARDDAAAARRIAEALRASGLEVWFDENELRGGDAWDQKIRRQINDCTLFVALISQHTEARAKGYFRLEWRLAVEQTHMLLDGVPFVMPVVIDDTPESAAAVPPEFLRVQWTRLPGGLPTPQFVEQIKRLLTTAPAAGITAPPIPLRPAPAPTPPSPEVRHAFRARLLGLGAVMVIVALALGWWIGRTPPASAPAIETAARRSAPPTTTAPAAPKVSDKSIAVLPFANLSTEKENEFFADGVHDDVITNLAKIRDLTVISRTSVLAYRDPAARNLKKIAADLGVATILEGSIRRVGTKVHMNAQLIDVRSDAHLWADTFDGDASDIFALQASLAQKIAAALKATLTPDERSLIERRPTQNPEAYELYSRGWLLEQALGPFSARPEYEKIVSLFEQAIAKDPGFALAYAHLSVVDGTMFWFGAVDPTNERRARAEAALAMARQFAPDAPETHVAQGAFAYLCNNDWQGALAEYAIAEASLPNDAQLQYRIGIAHRRLAEWPEATRRFERSVALNPHDLSSVSTLVDTVFALRRYQQSRDLAQRYLAIYPDDWRLRTFQLRSQFALDGDRAALARAWAAPRPGQDLRARAQAVYESALLAGDFAAADRALANPQLTILTTAPGTTIEPVPLHRAVLAWRLGRPDDASRFADEALACFRSRTWTPRQQPLIGLAMARAEACAGRAEAAIRDGRAALAAYVKVDVYSAVDGEQQLGRIYALLGRREEAFGCLRHVVAQADATTPNELRIDIVWSRLADDPRLDEILKSAKPL